MRKRRVVAIPQVREDRGRVLPLVQRQILRIGTRIRRELSLVELLRRIEHELRLIAVLLARKHLQRRERERQALSFRLLRAAHPRHAPLCRRRRKACQTLLRRRFVDEPGVPVKTRLVLARLPARTELAALMAEAPLDLKVIDRLESFDLALAPHDELPAGGHDRQILRTPELVSLVVLLRLLLPQNVPEAPGHRALRRLQPTVVAAHRPLEALRDLAPHARLLRDVKPQATASSPPWLSHANQIFCFYYITEAASSPQHISKRMRHDIRAKTHRHIVACTAHGKLADRVQRQAVLARRPKAKDFSEIFSFCKTRDGKYCIMYTKSCWISEKKGWYHDAERT